MGVELEGGGGDQGGEGAFDGEGGGFGLGFAGGQKDEVAGVEDGADALGDDVVGTSSGWSKKRALSARVRG